MFLYDDYTQQSGCLGEVQLETEQQLNQIHFHAAVARSQATCPVPSRLERQASAAVTRILHSEQEN